jgi:hypothetical protein
MKWKAILRRLHPENLVDCLVDIILWVTEVWAIVRAIVTVLLIVLVIIYYITDKLPSDINLFTETINDLQKDNRTNSDW